MMRKLEYEVKFTTPAFLGNAEQAGQWRTPPFKALLRQWWRVVYAANRGFAVDVGAMRSEEGRLFGNAWLENDFRKSLIRLRLGHWGKGKQESWQPLPSVTHPEVPVSVGSDLYLGYGPITPPRRGLPVGLKNAAIQASEYATLSLACPDERVEEINAALALMGAYGTIGGRSRNGWGSFALRRSRSEGDNQEVRVPVPSKVYRPWHDSLALDWPHAVGRDTDGPLVWQTTLAHDDWKTLMRDLAIVKIGFRTQFKFSTGNNAAHPESRHWLSHPVTHHNVSAWNNGRLPNSLRFKVRPDKDDPEKLRGVVFHVPCRPPWSFSRDTDTIRRVWTQVHQLLDETTRPPQRRAYAMVSDEARRDVLKHQLDTVTLERISE